MASLALDTHAAALHHSNDASECSLAEPLVHGWTKGTPLQDMSFQIGGMPAGNEFAHLLTLLGREFS